uniref:Cupin-like domain-containing protein n=1 Tax=viral metagenome TaxID=1070528 RepID=A0A6C0JEH1_9ZZZZ
MDYSNNEHLQEVCEVKQPVLFDYRSVNPEFFEKLNYDTISEPKYGNSDIKVKDINDYWESDEAVDYIVLPFQTGTNLMRTDPKSKYFTENNQDFLEDTGLLKTLRACDMDIKSNMTAVSKYDICTASKDTVTPLRYHLYNRHFICVNTGKIRVKMSPWKSTKYLYQNRDFENFEFRSPINVWKPQKKYMHEMDKIKFLEFEVVEGHMLFIPPYWWYSIKYTSDTDSLVCGFTYSSVMNCVSNSPELMKYYIQQTNIKKRMTKVLEIQETTETKKEEVLDESKENTLQNTLDKKEAPTVKQLQDIIS